VKHETLGAIKSHLEQFAPIKPGVELGVRTAIERVLLDLVEPDAEGIWLRTEKPEAAWLADGGQILVRAIAADHAWGITASPLVGRWRVAFELEFADRLQWQWTVNIRHHDEPFTVAGDWGSSTTPNSSDWKFAQLLASKVGWPLTPDTE